MNKNEYSCQILMELEFSQQIFEKYTNIHQPPQSRADVKERVELYLYSASGPSRPLLGRTFALCVCVWERERERASENCMQ